MSAVKSPALPALTALRFFAALAIVIHHCNGVFWATADLGPLDAGVSFFFVLSGFILTYVYRDLPRSAAAWRDFYRARIARIWPLHAVCLLLTIWLVATPEPFNVVALIANLFLFHAWLPWDRLFFSYNYVSWSISTELFFYLALPCLVRCRTGWIWLLISLSVGCAIALAVTAERFDLATWQVSGNQISTTGLLYTDPLTRLAEFLIGIVTARLFLRQQAATQQGFKRWTLFEFVSVAAFCSGFVLLRWAGITDFFETDDAAVLTLATEWGQHVALAPLAAVVIYTFAHQRGALAQVLSARWLVFAGEISFALYLVHQLLLRAMQPHLAHPGIGMFGIYMMVILLAAVLLHGCVERPARGWLTAHANR